MGNPFAAIPWWQLNSGSPMPLDPFKSSHRRRSRVVDPFTSPLSGIVPEVGMRRAQEATAEQDEAKQVEKEALLQQKERQKLEAEAEKERLRQNTIDQGNRRVEQQVATDKAEKGGQLTETKIVQDPITGKKTAIKVPQLNADGSPKMSPSKVTVGKDGTLTRKQGQKPEEKLGAADSNLLNADPAVYAAAKGRLDADAKKVADAKTKATDRADLLDAQATLSEARQNSVSQDQFEKATKTRARVEGELGLAMERVRKTHDASSTGFFGGKKEGYKPLTDDEARAQVFASKPALKKSYDEAIATHDDFSKRREAVKAAGGDLISLRRQKADELRGAPLPSAEPVSDEDPLPEDDEPAAVEPAPAPTAPDRDQYSRDAQALGQNIAAFNEASQQPPVDEVEAAQREQQAQELESERVRLEGVRGEINLHVQAEINQTGTALADAISQETQRDTLGLKPAFESLTGMSAEDFNHARIENAKRDGWDKLPDLSEDKRTPEQIKSDENQAAFKIEDFKHEPTRSELMSPAGMLSPTMLGKTSGPTYTDDPAPYHVLSRGEVVVNPKLLQPLRGEQGGDWRAELQKAQQAGTITPAQMQIASSHYALVEASLRDQAVGELEKFKPSVPQDLIKLAVDAGLATETRGGWDISGKNYSAASVSDAIWKQGSPELKRKLASELLNRPNSLSDEMRNNLNAFVSGAAKTVTAIPKAVGIAGDILADKIGLGYNGGLADNIAYRIGSGADKLLDDTILPQDYRQLNDVATQGFQALGSSVGFMATGGVTGAGVKVLGARLGFKFLLGEAANNLAVAATGAASQAVDTYEQAKGAGMDDDKLWLPFVLGGVVGTSEVLPISKMLERLTPAGQKAAGKALANMLMEATEETVQEFGQGVAGNLIEQKLWNKYKGTFEGAFGAAGIGGGTGATMSLFTSLLSNAIGRVRRIQQQRQLPLLKAQNTAFVANIHDRLALPSTAATPGSDAGVAEQMTAALHQVSPEASPVTAEEIAMARELGPTDVSPDTQQAIEAAAQTQDAGGTELSDEQADTEFAGQLEVARALQLEQTVALQRINSIREISTLEPGQQAVAQVALKITNNRAVTSEQKALLLGTPANKLTGQPAIQGVVANGKPVAYENGGQIVITDAGLERLREIAPITSKMLPKSEQAQLEAQEAQQTAAKSPTKPGASPSKPATATSPAPSNGLDSTKTGAKPVSPADSTLYGMSKSPESLVFDAPGGFAVTNPQTGETEFAATRDKALERTRELLPAPQEKPNDTEGNISAKPADPKLPAAAGTDGPGAGASKPTATYTESALFGQAEFELGELKEHDKQVLRTLLPLLNRNAAQLKALGDGTLSFRDNPKMGPMIASAFNEDRANNRLILNMANLVDHSADEMLAVLGEEIVHFAQGEVLRVDWEASKQGTFAEFVESEYKALAMALEGIRFNADPSVDFREFDKVYRGFSRLNAFQKTTEIVRALIEVRRKNTISEERLIPFIKRVRLFFNRVLNFLRKVEQEAGKSPEVSRALGKIEEILRQVDALAAQAYNQNAPSNGGAPASQTAVPASPGTDPAGLESGRVEPGVSTPVGGASSVQRLTDGERADFATRLGIAPERLGGKSVITQNGQNLEVVYFVMPAAETKTSHRWDGSTNPDYDQSLQPRDRSLPQYRKQSQNIAQNLDFDMMAFFPGSETPATTARDGAPTTDLAGNTITGNGRDNAVVMAYQLGFPSASRYAARFAEKAELFGIDPEAVKKVTQPVLKRAIVSNIAKEALIRFSQESNESQAMGTNSIEQAAVDAGRLTPQLLALFDPAYHLDSAKNLPFLQAFQQSVIEGRTRDNISDKANVGNLSRADLVKRVRLSLFSFAYQSSEEGRAALERMAGESEDNGRNITNALLTVSPLIARLQAGIREGSRVDLDIAPQLARAAQDISEAIANRPKKQGTKAALADLLAQRGFEDDPLVRDITAWMVENRSSRERMEQVLTNYVEAVNRIGDPRNGDMFGGEQPTRETIWQLAKKSSNRETGAAPAPSIEQRANALRGFQKLTLARDAGQQLTAGQEVSLRTFERILGQTFFPFEDRLQENFDPTLVSAAAKETDESQVANPIDFHASPEEKLQQLRHLSELNRPIIKNLIAEIDRTLGTESKMSDKDDEKVLAKAARPSILAEKPWHGVEHIRDALRFKTKITNFSQVMGIFQILKRHGIEVVKLDTGKMFAPKQWGWRFVAFDLRMPNGQLVEYYSPLREMDEKSVKGPNHHLFELWRNKTREEIEDDLSGYRTALKESRDRYDAAFQEAVSRMGFADLSAAEASWNSLVARLESLTSSSEDMQSSGKPSGTPGDQAPSSERLATKPSLLTKASLEAGSKRNQSGGITDDNMPEPGDRQSRSVGAARKTDDRQLDLFDLMNAAPAENPAAVAAIPQEVEAPTAPASSAGEKATRSGRLSQTLSKILLRGGSITWQQLFDHADQAFGGTQADAVYTVKDAYDALEVGLNRVILATNTKKSYPGHFNPAKSTPEVAVGQIYELKRLLERIPTQSKRTAETDEFQQFSTIPSLAFAANWVAGVREGDVMAEPSAGVGGLAVFAKAAGATLILNELSPRRHALLAAENMTPRNLLFMENAEQFNNILPANLRPNVVVMNPPFSSTAGRMEGARDTANGAAHIEQALKRLVSGGRLVAIVGEGMAADRPAFSAWWKKIAKEYTVRANVGVNGNEYAKYGTTFDNQILVIDRPVDGQPAGAYNPVTGSVERVEDLIPLLEGVRHERHKSTGSIEGQRGGISNPVVAVPTGKPGDSKSSDETGGGRTAATQQPRVAGPGEQTDGGQRGSKTDLGLDNGQSEGPDGKGGDRGKAGSPTAGESNRVTRTAATAAEVRSEEALTDAVFDQYQPRVVLPGTTMPPVEVQESSAMASVTPPAPSYQTAIPKDVFNPRKGETEARLSALAMESIILAGQAHQSMVPLALTETEQENYRRSFGVEAPKEVRRGFFIGDGTGMGKGRQVMGVILDNWMQGRKKAIWVSEKPALLNDAKRDADDVYKMGHHLFDLSKFGPADRVNKGEGIAFTSYSTLRSGEKQAPEGQKPKSRVDQIVEWAGADFDGVLALDEAHNMGNAVPMKGKRGPKEPSQQALMALELQRRLPLARVVYLSATGATEVSNLAYADRLGLWGAGTPFANVMSFVNEIGASGVAAMEMVARDIKALGLYVARAISWRGVGYDRIEHTLTPDQTEIYNALAEAWQMVLQNMEKAMEVVGIVHRDETSGKAFTKNANAKSAAVAQFWGTHQRFFNQVITAMKMPTVLSEIEKEVANGRAVVIQLVNTNQASADRALARKKQEAAESGEDADLDDLDMTPRDSLMQMILNSFPVVQQEQYQDGENGYIKSRPVLDSKGNPVLNAEAVQMREDLLNQLAAIRVPDGPLEMLLNHFGKDAVAEVTGRTQRVVYGQDEQGRTVRKVEKRGKAKGIVEANEFMEGKRDILVFSQAGGTGRSYHADRRAKNQKVRVHVLLQAGWRADQAVQGFGRTHRNNQKQPPFYRLTQSNIVGERRFISSIARRLDQLGALTKGQRQAASQGLFKATDNLESDEAREALRWFFNDLTRGLIPNVSEDVVSKQMGLRLRDDEGNRLDEPPPITQFLNRLLSLKLDAQKAVFDAFEDRMQRIIDKAIENGTLNQGMENIIALSTKVVDRRTIFTDERTKAKTEYVKLELEQPVELTPFDKVSKRTEFAKNLRSGQVYAVLGESTETNTVTGQVYVAKRLQGVTRRSSAPAGRMIDPEFWQPLTSEQAETEWQSQFENAPKTRKETKHYITGTILPIWDRLQLGKGNMQVRRVQTDEGERMIGVVVPESEVGKVLANFGVQGDQKQFTAADGVKSLQAGEPVRFSNGWRIRPVRVSGEQRYELTGPNFSNTGEMQSAGVFSERINWAMRYFVPVAQVEDVLKKLLTGRQIVEASMPSNKLAASARKPRQGSLNLGNYRNPGELDFDGPDWAAKAAELDKIKGLIEAQARNWKNIPGYPAAELLDVARDAAVDAVREWDPAKGGLAPRVVYFIKNRMLSLMRDQTRHGAGASLDRIAGESGESFGEITRDTGMVAADRRAQSSDAVGLISRLVNELPDPRMRAMARGMMEGKSAAQVVRELKFVAPISEREVGSRLARATLKVLNDRFGSLGIMGTDDVLGGREAGAAQKPAGKELPSHARLSAAEVKFDFNETADSLEEAKDNFDPEDASTWPIHESLAMEYEEAIANFDPTDPDSFDSFLPEDLEGAGSNIQAGLDEVESILTALRKNKSDEAEPGISQEAMDLALKLQNRLKSDLAALTERATANKDTAVELLEEVRQAAADYLDGKESSFKLVGAAQKPGGVVPAKYDPADPANRDSTLVRQPLPGFGPRPVPDAQTGEVDPFLQDRDHFEMHGIDEDMNRLIGQGERILDRESSDNGKAKPPARGRSWWMDILAGQLDRLDYYVPGVKNILLTEKREEALSSAAIGGVLDKIKADIRKYFGDPVWWQKNARRLRQFTAELLPAAAHLEVEGFNPDGSFRFKNFMMRAGVIPAAGKGVIPGRTIERGGEKLVIGPEIKDGPHKGSHVLLRPMSAQRQEAIYNEFIERWGEVAGWLDQWITTDVTKAGKGPGFDEFNRYSLHSAYNESPLGGMGYVSGYTPDVATQRTVMGFLAKISGLSRSANKLKYFVSPGRQTKTGYAREMGEVKNLFDGFSARRMEASREKIRAATRAALIEAAVVDAGKMAPGTEQDYIDVQSVIFNIANALRGQRGLGEKDIPNQLNLLADENRAFLERILGPAARFKDREGAFMRREVYEGLMKTVAAERVEKSLIEMLGLAVEQIRTKQYAEAARSVRDAVMSPKWVDAALQRVNTGYLANPGTFVTNVGSNELFMVVRAANRAAYSAASLLAGDRREAKVGWRELVNIISVQSKDRFVNRELLQKWVPRELFNDNTAVAAIHASEGQSAWESFKDVNVGGAVLKLIRYGDVDGMYKQGLAYAGYRAMAEVAADEAGITGKKAREDWMLNWVKEKPANDPVHREVEDVAKLYLMDYVNVPAWLDATGGKGWKATAVRGVLPFVKFPYNMAKQFVVMGPLSAHRAFRGKTGQERINAISNLMVLGALAGLAGAVKGLGGADDPEDPIIGGNIDDEGNRLQNSMRTGARINVTGFVRRVLALAHMRGTPLYRAFDGEEDTWLRYANYPYFREALTMASLAEAYGSTALESLGMKTTDFGAGKIEKAHEEASNLLEEYASLGILAKMALNVFGWRMAYDQGKTKGYVWGETLYDFSTSGVMPAAWRKSTVTYVDPLYRRQRPSKTLAYDADFIDALENNTPGLSRRNPAQGEVQIVGANTDVDEELRTLEEMGAGDASTRTYLDTKGNPKRAYVDPTQVVRRTRAQELVRQMLGLNLKQINRTGYQKARSGDPMKP
jgi:predicted RNA methylase